MTPCSGSRPRKGRQGGFCCVALLLFTFFVGAVVVPWAKLPIEETKSHREVMRISGDMALKAISCDVLRWLENILIGDHRNYVIHLLTTNHRFVQIRRTNANTPSVMLLGAEYPRYMSLAFGKNTVRNRVPIKLGLDVLHCRPADQLDGEIFGRRIAAVLPVRSYDPTLHILNRLIDCCGIGSDSGDLPVVEEHERSVDGDMIGDTYRVSSFVGGKNVACDYCVSDQKQQGENTYRPLYIFPVTVLAVLAIAIIAYGLFCCPTALGVLIILTAGIPIYGAVYLIFDKILRVGF